MLVLCGIERTVDMLQLILEFWFIDNYCVFQFYKIPPIEFNLENMGHGTSDIRHGTSDMGHLTWDI